MKKTTHLILGTLLLCSMARAQYKKVNFFNKDGRVYELGVVNSFFPNNEGKAPLSILYSNSIEADKKVSYFSDIEFMLKSKFSYTATYNDPVTFTPVTGKVIADRGSALVLKYGAQYRFIDTKKEKVKLVPYLRLGLAIGYDFGASNPVNEKGQSVYPDPEVNQTAVFLGVEAGAGIAYYFTDNFGIRLGAAYRPGASLASGFASANVYNSFKSHPLASISFRYKIFNRD